jgi:DNA-binding transcriptional LysR family regulator
MRDLDLKTLRLWVAVCDHQNIKQAAAAAHIEPSAISKRITQLESTLGTALLVRGRRGVLPTEAGQALLAHARSLLFTLERIEADVADHGQRLQGLRGHVRLVASASAVAEHLLDDVAGFLRDPAHAGIRVDIEERLSIDVVRAVREGRATLGVCWDSVGLQGVQQQPYRDDELVLAVPQGHPLAKARRLQFAQTLDHAHVGLPPATAVYSLLNRAAAQAGRSLSYRVVVSSFDAALRAVAAGLGVTVIPREVAQWQATRAGLCIVGLRDAFARRRFAICYRDAGGLSLAARRLLDHLAKQAQAAPAQAQATAPEITPARPMPSAKRSGPARPWPASPAD